MFCDIASHDSMSYEMTSRDMNFSDMTSRDIMCHDMTSCGSISCDYCSALAEQLFPPVVLWTHTVCCAVRVLYP